MSARDPQALRRLTAVLLPVAERLQYVAAAARTRTAVAAAVRSVPRLGLWVAVLTIGTSLLVAVPAVVPPLLAIALAGVVFLLKRARPSTSRAELVVGALACDRAHGNQDRLAAATELAAEAPARSALGEALAQAAIEDGVQSLRRIDPQRVMLPPEPPAPAWWLAAVSLLLLAVLPWLLPQPAWSPALEERFVETTPGMSRGADAAQRAEAAPDRRNVETVPKARADEAKERKEAERKVGAPPPPPKPAAPAPAVPAASGQGASGTDAAGDSSQNGAPKAAPAGKPGSGQSGGGQGSAASGAPEPEPSEQQAKVPPKPKAPKPQPNQPQQDGKPSESAGAPSGPSRGSGRLSAVGNKRNDQNRGQEREDDPEVEDEPVEDETDEQEQRGGVMPMRRGDNRPTARELSISGDGPPDNGRGGPTPPKKARGTASLVLGLRLPDSVRGQPNPGTAKTSLEQIPPRPSAAEPGLARAVGAGRPTTPQSLRPPARSASLLQSYHALLRALDSASAGAPIPASAPAATPAASPKDPR